MMLVLSKETFLPPGPGRDMNLWMWGWSYHLGFVSIIMMAFFLDRFDHGFHFLNPVAGRIHKSQEPRIESRRFSIRNSQDKVFERRDQQRGIRTEKERPGISVIQAMPHMEDPGGIDCEILSSLTIRLSKS